MKCELLFLVSVSAASYGKLDRETLYTLRNIHMSRGIYNFPIVGRKWSRGEATIRKRFVRVTSARTRNSKAYDG